MIAPPQTLTGVDDRLADPAEVARADALIDAMTADGLPWDRPLAAARFWQRGSWYRLHPVVWYRRTAVLGLPSANWYHRRGRGLTDPEAFSGDFWLADTIEENHATVLGLLRATLGSPVETSVSNTMEHTWWVGPLRILVRTFLPGRLDAPNPTLDRFPQLARRTSVDVESVAPDRTPDPTVAAAVEGDATFTFDRDSAPWTSPRHVRRHPVVDARAVDEERLVAWAHGDRIGVTARRASVVAPWHPGAELVHHRITPARGGGTTWVELPGPRRHPALQLCRHGRFDALDAVVPALADALDLPLRTVEHPDE